MEEREDQFLKKVFTYLETGVEMSPEFNNRVLGEVKRKSNLGFQIIHYLRYVFPILFLAIVSGILILIFKGNVIADTVMEYLPMLRPWHIFMAFIILYFHFVRSILILAFLSFKNRYFGSGKLMFDEN